MADVSILKIVSNQIAYFTDHCYFCAAPGGYTENSGESAEIRTS